MAWLNSQITVDDAKTQNNEVYEILVDEWGKSNAATGTNLCFPSEGTRALPVGAGVAIGPRSTVDRAWVVYNLQKLVPASPFLSPLWDFTRRVSVGVPLMFSQPASPNGVSETTIKTTTGSVSILPCIGGLTPYTGAQGTGVANPFDTDGTKYRTAYLKADGSAGVFGASNPDAYWMSPLLHLYYYLQAPSQPPPLKRFPLHVRITKGAAGGPGVESLLAMIPVFGRKTISLQMRPETPGGAGVFRFATIQQVNAESVGTTIMQEATRHTSASLATGVSAVTTLTDVYADYLMVYLTPTVAGSGYLDIVAND